MYKAIWISVLDRNLYNLPYDLMSRRLENCKIIFYFGIVVSFVSFALSDWWWCIGNVPKRRRVARFPLHPRTEKWKTARAIKKIKPSSVRGAHESALATLRPPVRLVYCVVFGIVAYWKRAIKSPKKPESESNWQCKTKLLPTFNLHSDYAASVHT